MASHPSKIAPTDGCHLGGRLRLRWPDKPLHADQERWWRSTFADVLAGRRPRTGRAAATTTEDTEMTDERGADDPSPRHPQHLTVALRALQSNGGDLG